MVGLIRNRSKYGLVKSMLNSSKDGLDAMLENGSWFIPFNKDGLSVIATKLGTPLTLDSYTSNMCMQSWDMSSYARAMIELRANVELKDTIIVSMPKLFGEGFYMCTIRVEYELKPPSCSSCNVFGHVLNECLKSIISDVEKNLKNPRQAARDAIASKEVSNSNPFDVLNSVEKDNDLVERIDKIERQIIDGKLTLVDDDENPLPKVVSTENADSDSEVEDVVDDHVVFMESIGLKHGADSGYGTNSLLEQGRTTPRDDDYDPYDDDLYEIHDMCENLPAICDDLDITIYGRKKK
ncbi:putative reverse transcriptase domain-containing protein [Tanacetum coccineum]